MVVWSREEQDSLVNAFTVGDDPVLDLKLLLYDIQASLAHAKMLEKIKVLSSDELVQLEKGLGEIKQLHSDGKFLISKKQEDGHTAIEEYLTEKYGEVGKKIHTGRSRNDQVKAALHLYFKDKLKEIEGKINLFNTALDEAIKKYGNIEMPGYTHMQKAMPSSIGLWLGSFLAASKDNLKLLKTVKDIIDQNPLGSGAGFGVPLNIDKELTKDLLGFSKVQDNPVYVQHSRGKFEGMIIDLISAIMLDLGKLSSDLMLFSMQEFDYVKLPDNLLTGSSIMPQKKNYDILELVRGKYHIALGHGMAVKSLSGNLISGYNRDVQLTKDPIIKSLEIGDDCLGIMTLVVSNLSVSEENCKKAMTKDLYATSEVYKLVEQGMSFREAYHKVKEGIE